VFRITVTNTGDAPLTILSLIDSYPREYLKYVGADPPSDDLNDDGEIVWSDLTEQLGDLQPGNSHVVIVNFELRRFPPDGQQIENLAIIEGQDVIGRLVTDDSLGRLTPDPHCTDLKLVISTDPVQLAPDSPPGRYVLVITVDVENIGPFAIDNGYVLFGYEKTPLIPDDDPNPDLIGYVETGPLAVGSRYTAIQRWDVTDFEFGEMPVYLFAMNEDFVECDTADLMIYDITVPVRLATFDAQGEDRQIELSWTTETEVNNAGFWIYRAASYVGPYVRIGDGIIPGAGSSFTPKTYRYTDESLVNGQPYFYRLAMVDTKGREELSRTVAAVPVKDPARLMLRTRADNWSYATGENWRQLVKLENKGGAVTGRFWLLLAADGAEPAAMISDLPVTIPAGFTGEGAVYNHYWSGLEQSGRYTVFAVLLSESGGLLVLDVSEFRYGTAARVP